MGAATTEAERPRAARSSVGDRAVVAATSSDRDRGPIQRLPRRAPADRARRLDVGDVAVVLEPLNNG